MTEQRSFSVSGESGDLTLQGRAIVFTEPALIEDFYEVIEPTALNGCRLKGIPLLYNHDHEKIPLARTPKTMSLNIEPDGVYMRATLSNSERCREIYEAVRRGDLCGMSFAFVVKEDSYDTMTNTRRIIRISEILECSITPFPAYASASVECRSHISRKRAVRQLINEMKRRFLQ